MGGEREREVLSHLELLLGTDESKVRRVHVWCRSCFGLDLIRTWNRDTRVVQNVDCHHWCRMQQSIVLPCINYDIMVTSFVLKLEVYITQLIVLYLEQ